MKCSSCTKSLDYLMAQCPPTGGPATLCTACAITANREHVKTAIDSGALPNVPRHYKGWKEPHDPCSPKWPTVSKEYAAYIKSVLADRAAKAQQAIEDEDNKRRERAARVRIPAPLAPKPVTPQLPPPCTVVVPTPAQVVAKATEEHPAPVPKPTIPPRQPADRIRYVIPPQFRSLPIGKLWTAAKHELHTQRMAR